MKKCVAKVGNYNHIRNQDFGIPEWNNPNRFAVGHNKQKNPGFLRDFNRFGDKNVITVSYRIVSFKYWSISFFPVRKTISLSFNCTYFAVYSTLSYGNLILSIIGTPGCIKPSFVI